MVWFNKFKFIVSGKIINNVLYFWRHNKLFLELFLYTSYYLLRKIDTNNQKANKLCSLFQ